MHQTNCFKEEVFQAGGDVEWSHDWSIKEGRYAAESHVKPHGRGPWYELSPIFFHTYLTHSLSFSCVGATVKMPPIPVVPENHNYVLAEFDCLDPLLSALRLDSGRLKVVILASFLFIFK